MAGTEAAITPGVAGLPLPLVIASGRDSAGQAKFIVGLGEGSINAVLAPPKTLSSSSSFQSASGALGGAQPGIIVSVPTVLALLEGAGLDEDPTIAGLVPFLHSITNVYGGDQSLGSVERFKLVLGLHGARLRSRAARSRFRSSCSKTDARPNPVDAIVRERRFTARFDRVAADHGVAIADGEDAFDDRRSIVPLRAGRAIADSASVIAS